MNFSGINCLVAFQWQKSVSFPPLKTLVTIWWQIGGKLCVSPGINSKSDMRVAIVWHFSDIEFSLAGINIYGEG